VSVVFCDLSDAGDLENKEQKNGLAKKKLNLQAGLLVILMTDCRTTV